MGKIGNLRQKKIYDFIVGYFKENGYAPTVREISNGVGLKSTSTIHCYLKKLNESGLLIVKDGEPRAIKVVGYIFIKE